ncbi:MAG: hypothetical protein FWC57_06195, partial [Endomicrobia bacterium]|nr:hypothetical protein [Endomicrobiia bacterium]
SDRIANIWTWIKLHLWIDNNAQYKQVNSFWDYPYNALVWVKQHIGIDKNISYRTPQLVPVKDSSVRAVFSNEQWHNMIKVLGESSENFPNAGSAIEWMNENYAELAGSKSIDLNNITPANAEFLVGLITKPATDINGNPIIIDEKGGILAPGVMPEQALYPIEASDWAKNPALAAQHLAAVSRIWTQLTQADIDAMNETYSYFDYERGAQVSMNLSNKTDENGNPARVTAVDVQQLYQFIFIENPKYNPDVEGSAQYVLIDGQNFSSNPEAWAAKRIEGIKLEIGTLNKINGAEFTVAGQKISGLELLKAAYGIDLSPATDADGNQYVPNSELNKLRNLLYTVNGDYSYVGKTGETTFDENYPAILAFERWLSDNDQTGIEKLLNEAMHTQFIGRFYNWIGPVAAAIFGVNILSWLIKKSVKKMSKRSRGRKNLLSMPSSGGEDAAGISSEVVRKIQVHFKIEGMKNIQKYYRGGRDVDAGKLEEYFGLFLSADDAKKVAKALKSGKLTLDESLVTLHDSDGVDLPDFAQLLQASDIEAVKTALKSSLDSNDIFVINEILSLGIVKIERFKEILGSSVHEENSVLINRVRAALLKEYLEYVYGKIKAEGAEAVLNPETGIVLPVAPVLALRRLTDKGAFSADDLKTIAEQTENFNGFYAEVISKYVRNEFDTIAQYLPKSWGLKESFGDFANGENGEAYDVVDFILKNIESGVETLLSFDPLSMTDGGIQMDAHVVQGEPRSLQELIISSLNALPRKYTDDVSLGAYVMFAFGNMSLTRNIIDTEIARAKAGEITQAQARQNIENKIRQFFEFTEVVNYSYTETKANVTEDQTRSNEEAVRQRQLNDRFSDQDYMLMFALLNAMRRDSQGNLVNINNVDLFALTAEQQKIFEHVIAFLGIGLSAEDIKIFEHADGTFNLVGAIAKFIEDIKNEQAATDTAADAKKEAESVEKAMKDIVDAVKAVKEATSEEEREKAEKSLKKAKNALENAKKDALEAAEKARVAAKKAIFAKAGASEAADAAESIAAAHNLDEAAAAVKAAQEAAKAADIAVKKAVKEKILAGLPKAELGKFNVEFGNTAALLISMLGSQLKRDMPALYESLDSRSSEALSEERHGTVGKEYDKLIKDTTLTGNIVKDGLRVLRERVYGPMLGFKAFSIKNKALFRAVTITLLVLGVFVLMSGFLPAVVAMIPVLGPIVPVLFAPGSLLSVMAIDIGMALITGAIVVPKFIFGKAGSREMKNKYTLTASIFSVFWGGFLGGFFVRGLSNAAASLIVGTAFSVFPIITVLFTLAVFAIIAVPTFKSIFDLVNSVNGLKKMYAETGSKVDKKAYLRVVLQFWGAVGIVAGLFGIGAFIFGSVVSPVVLPIVILTLAAGLILSAISIFLPGKLSSKRAYKRTITAKYAELKEVEKHKALVYGQSLDEVMDEFAENLYEKDYISAVERDRIKARDFTRFENGEANEYLRLLLDSLARNKYQTLDLSSIPKSTVHFQAAGEKVKRSAAFILSSKSFDRGMNVFGYYANRLKRSWTETYDSKIGNIRLGAGLSENDRKNLEEFIRALRDPNERTIINIPKMETGEGQRILSGIIFEIENWFHYKAMDEQRSLEDSALEIYEMHRLIAYHNADFKYFDAIKEVIHKLYPTGTSQEERRGSLENAYRQLLKITGIEVTENLTDADKVKIEEAKNKGLISENEQVFILNYKSYKALASRKLNIVFDEATMSGDRAFVFDQESGMVSEWKSLDDFIKSWDYSEKYKPLIDELQRDIVGKYGSLTVQECAEAAREIVYRHSDLIQQLYSEGNDKIDKFLASMELVFSAYLNGIEIDMDYNDHKLITNNKNAQIAGALWKYILFFCGLAKNRDALVGITPGQHLFASEVATVHMRGLRSNVVIINPVLNVLGAERGDNGQPMFMNGYLYGRGDQTPWMGPVQAGYSGSEIRNGERVYTGQLSGYGKMRGLIQAMVSAVFSTAEDSSSMFAYRAAHMFGDQDIANVPIGIRDSWNQETWERNVAWNTGIRYAAAGPRFEQDAASALALSPLSENYDFRLSTRILSSHYMNTLFALLFVALVPILVIFSSYAFLVPFFVSIFISFAILMQSVNTPLLAVNIKNTGSIGSAFSLLLRSIIPGFPYFTNQIPAFIYSMLRSIIGLFTFSQSTKEPKLDKTDSSGKRLMFQIAVVVGIIGVLVTGAYIGLVIFMGAASALPVLVVVSQILQAVGVQLIYLLASVAFINGAGVFRHTVDANDETKDSNVKEFYKAAPVFLLVSPLLFAGFIVDIFVKSFFKRSFMEAILARNFKFRERKFKAEDFTLQWFYDNMGKIKKQDEALYKAFIEELVQSRRFPAGYKKDESGVTAWLKDELSKPGVVRARDKEIIVSALNAVNKKNNDAIKRKETFGLDVRSGFSENALIGYRRLINFLVPDDVRAYLRDLKRNNLNEYNEILRKLPGYDPKKIGETELKLLEKSRSEIEKEISIIHPDKPWENKGIKGWFKSFATPHKITTILSVITVGAGLLYFIVPIVWGVSTALLVVLGAAAGILIAVAIVKLVKYLLAKRTPAQPESTVSQEPASKPPSGPGEEPPVAAVLPSAKETAAKKVDIFDEAATDQLIEEVIAVSGAEWSQGSKDIFRSTRKEYFRQLRAKARGEKTTELRIGENLTPLSQMTAADREYVAIEQLEDILKDPKGAYSRAARKAVVDICLMNGGLGSSIKRDDLLKAVKVYKQALKEAMKIEDAVLREKTVALLNASLLDGTFLQKDFAGIKIKYGAKADDLYFVVKGADGKVSLKSIMQIKLEKILAEKANGTYNGIRLANLVSPDSEELVNALYDKKDGDISGLKEGETIRTALDADTERQDMYPVIEYDSENNTVRFVTDYEDGVSPSAAKPAPGGHGVWLATIVKRILNKKAGGSSISVIGNSDAIASGPIK